MSNRANPDSPDFSGQSAQRPTGWTSRARLNLAGLAATAHHALMVLGITAMTALGMLFFKPDLADRIKDFSPFATETAEAAEQSAPAPAHAALNVMPLPPAANQVQTVSAKPLEPAHEALKKADVEALGNARQQQWVTAWLSKRYRVASDATNMLVSAAYMTAREIKLDPLLILSVMAIESGFNPFAESPVGAQGLMQVMSKVHHDKFRPLGGVQAALNPVANIRVGSLILKDYVTRGGSVEAGLKLYVGAGASDSDSGYGAKVLAEYRRLKDVAMGKKVPIYTTSASATSDKPATQDKAPADGKSAKVGEGAIAAASAELAAL